MKLPETPQTADGKIDFAAIHPDPEIAREVVIGTLEGMLAEAHAGLLRALDYRAATPQGLAIKGDVRDALSRTGYDQSLGYRAEF